MRNYNSKLYRRFWNVLVIERLMKFLKSEASQLKEMGIEDFSGLCGLMGVRHNEHATFCIGRLSATSSNQENLHRAFDLNTAERNQLSLELKRLRDEQQRLKRRKIGDLDYFSYKEHFENISALGGTILGLQSRLDSLPVRNGRTNGLFSHPSEELLESRGWIRKTKGANPYYALTKKGEGLLIEQDKLFGMIVGIIGMGQKVSPELLADMWEQIRKKL